MKSLKKIFCFSTLLYIAIATGCKQTSSRNQVSEDGSSLPFNSHLPSQSEMSTRLNVNLAGTYTETDTFDPQQHLCSPQKENFWRGDALTDITFVAFGDTQFREFDPEEAEENYLAISQPPTYTAQDVETEILQKKEENNQMVQAINSLANTNWPSRFTSIDNSIHGTKVNGIRGILIAGDLVENSFIKVSDTNLEVSSFLEKYPLCGSSDPNKSAYPTYEGFGNHDFVPISGPEFNQAPNTHEISPSIQMVVDRNQHRKGILSKHSHGHYSWQWDNVHFVNLNLMVADNHAESIDKISNGKGVRPENAFESLTFLQADLAKHVGSSGRPIVLMMHYPLTNGSRHSATEKDAFNDFVLNNNYNVIAIIHGHSHASAVRALRFPRDTNLPAIKYIPVFDVGSPFYRKDKNNGNGHFTLIRITNDYLEAVNYSWTPASNNQVEALTGEVSWYAKKSLNTNSLEIGTPGNMTTTAPYPEVNFPL